ncbi:uncharacterized protein LOC135836499 [Planococcus citri]|uniref:uncharacterized protein LOC135836499 n=1 Tax=Planococcus citri TaxID=170843 RepID=UPI0031F8138A
MNSQPPLSFQDAVASAISEGSDTENLNLTDNYAYEGPPLKAMKIKRYQLHPKTYSPKWEQDPNYKGWVQRSKKGDGFYYCLACNQDYTCGKSELDKHASSRKHCINMMSLPHLNRKSDNSNQYNKTEPSDSVEDPIIMDPHEFGASSTSENSQGSSLESKEEAFGKYIISELKRIKKKKTYEIVKWEILQALQKAMLQEAETEEFED